MTKSKGLFFSFEGPDGSGKSTALNKIYEILSKNYPVLKTREPGGSPEVCEKIREIILHNKIDPRTEALLFAASRTEHVNNYIIPELEKGKIILCDRFLDSSIAYQGYGRKIGLEKILKINDFGINGFRPNYVFYFDISLEESLKRMENDNRNNNHMDQEFIKIKADVMEGYHQANQLDNKRHIIIDASKPIEEVSNEVLTKILEIIKSEYEH